MALEVAFTAMYLRVEGWRSCPRASWVHLDNVLRAEAGRSAPAGWPHLLRRHGFWQEALTLEDPGRVLAAYGLVASELTLTIASPEYPEGWRRNLRHGAPPALWRLGRPLGHGLGFVGSRELGALAESLAYEAGKAAVHRGFAFVSGGAVGADSRAAAGAMAGLCAEAQTGGSLSALGVTHVLARGFGVVSGAPEGVPVPVRLAQAVTALELVGAACGAGEAWRLVEEQGESCVGLGGTAAGARQIIAQLIELRDQLAGGEKCLIGGDGADFHVLLARARCTGLLSLAMPGSRFSSALAMERNPLIYAFGCGEYAPGEAATVVIKSRHGEGGTWAGATDCLRRRLGSLIVADWPGDAAVEALCVLGAHRAASVPELVALAESARLGGLAAANGVSRLAGRPGIAELELGWEESPPAAS